MKKLFRKFDKKSKASQATPSQQQPTPPASQAPQQAPQPTQIANQNHPQQYEEPEPQSSVVSSGFGVKVSGCPNCKDLNPSLTSHTTDGLTLDSWARKEYNVPPDTPAGEITVKEAKAILQTAQTGCIYCTIICIALNQMLPGWEEKSFMRMFVASGLPVVVRLQHGTTVTMENYQAPGYTMPQGGNLNLEMTVVIPDKPGIEIELYRPSDLVNQQIANNNVAIVLNQLNGRFGTASSRYNDAGDDNSLNFIKSQLDYCKSYHMSCSSEIAQPILPDRVIWLRAPTQDGLQLVEPKNAVANYICLSYCWGPMSPSIYLTNPETLAARKQGMRYSDLPPLFQDVVTVARKLNIDYLWIDRLCIVQGPGGDFAVQAPKMGDIYGNSTLTITAASATTENDRILKPRDSSWNHFQVDLNLDGSSSFQAHFRRRAIPLGKENQGGDYGKVSTRAWIWQERLLSKRNIFFTQAALKFECRCSSAWEGADPAHMGHSWSTRLDDEANLSWTRLVEDFSSRDITYASDRLPAIEAVMRRIAAKTRWTPIYGMWKDNLIETLVWSPAHNKEYKFAQAVPGTVAPTWSWTSVEGPISYQKLHAQRGSLYDADPFVHHLKLLGAFEKTGELMVEGKLVPAALRMRVEVSETGSQRTIYELGDDAASEQWIPIVADTHLRSYTGRFMHGETTPATQRVPAGEAVPSQGWVSTCYCLLVGIGQSRCVTLILGLSARSLNAFERLGMQESLPPAVFDNRANGQFVIV